VSNNAEQELFTRILSFKYDPVGFVFFALGVSVRPYIVPYLNQLNQLPVSGCVEFLQRGTHLTPRERKEHKPNGVVLERQVYVNLFGSWDWKECVFSNG
jgi:hypothetical protein